MKKALLPSTFIALLLTTAVVRAENIDQLTDTRTFDITPAAPPEPALKYDFLFDNVEDTRPGNAALLYHDAILMMDAELRKAADQAIEAYNKNDLKTFDSLVDTYGLAETGNSKRGLLIDLDLAARSTSCVWLPPPQYIDATTLLPHLQPISHGFTPVLQLRALRQLQLGKIDDAIDTLRLGYELSDKIGIEPTLISGLVAVSVCRRMNNVTCRLMSDPDCPNLYWALAEIRPRHRFLRASLKSERACLISSIKSLTYAHAGEALTAGQWHDIFNQLAAYRKTWAVNPAAPTPAPDPVADARVDLLAKAQSAYARSHDIPLGQVKKMDPAITLGHFYLEQYTAALDDLYKLHGLPYPQLLTEAQKYDQLGRQWQHEQPSNPFFFALPTIHNAILLFAKADREVAAMGVVEAIRAYAAGHQGQLPERLEEIADTPVPENPLTGKAFGYERQEGMAILSDGSAEAPLRYTIRLRK